MKQEYMTHDMKKTLMRMLTLMLLMMVSMGARAEVKVLFGEKGTEKYEGKGGTIQVKQEESRDGGKVTVRLAFIPDKNYTFDEKSLEVYKVFSPESATARALEIDGDALKLEEDKSTNPSEKHYHVDIDSKLALRVKEAQFINMGKSGDETELGTFFIANGNGYSSSNVANNFYLVPATNSNYATGQPHLTTSKTGQVLNSCWKVVQVTVGEKEYFRFIHVVDGKYLTANPAYSGTSGNDVGRLRVHLETMDTPDDNTLFERKANNNGGFNIRHKDMTGKINNSTTTYLDPAGGNIEGTNLTSARTATTSAGKMNVGGGIGYWTDEPAARWRFEPVPQNNTYTYNIVDRQGRIAIKYTTGADQPAAKALSDYTDIPEAIRSPYLDGETVQFYTFSDSYSTPEELLNLLTDENKITATPVTNNANIYVTYTTDHLSEKFLRLRGARAFNIVTNDGYAYDNSGTLAYDNVEANKTQPNHLWYISGNDPYAVQIKNLSTGNYLVSSTLPTLSLAASATNNFILMEESAAANADHESMSLMVATGNTYTNDPTKAVNAYPVNSNVTYHLIDKAGKLIVSVPSTSSELALPDEWVSPLVSEYHYYSTSGLSGDTYSPSGTITSPFDVGTGGDIYVTYDVSDAIDITGVKTYMLKFSDGVSFYQEDGSDGIISDSYKAVYPYNNGEFHLYVYGQEQWEAQLASGASTRTRWLWHIFSNHNGTNLTGADPYHVIFMSEQIQTIKDKKTVEGVEGDHNFAGNTYLRTYKPAGYGSVVTDVAYESLEYHTDYPAKMPTQWVNGGATEYMILGTSMLNMKLKTFDEIDGIRQTVTSFEQYWKNNPTANNLLAAGGIAKVTGNEEEVTLTTAQRTFLESANASLHKDAWHSDNVWAYTKPWEKFSNGSTDKALKEGEHWLQTISMGSGEFTLEEVSLVPQVILIDQHGWEIMRVPMYSDNACTVINTDALNKYNSPMVAEKGYHWYPKADKTSGYHKYRVSDPEIVIYEKNAKNKWVDSGGRYTHTSSSLSDIPYTHITDPVQDKSVKTDFYVTYTVKSQYANAYHGAATEDAVTATPYLLKQNNTYATYSGSGTTIATVATKPSRENLTNNMEWYLKPNFNIDREMGYKYAGETGAQDDAMSKDATEAAYMTNGQNGFDPYNVQIQNRAYPLRYFTANTTGSALSAGLWTGTSGTVALQNISTRQTAAGYDQTTLNITNATFMVVDDGAGNMRLMPRFDHSKVMQSFGTLETQTTAASEGDEGTGSQTLFLESVAEAKEIHSSDEITDPNGYYLLAEDFTFTSDFTSISNFTGVIDGQLHTISGTLTKPLVNTANGAIIRNVILESVSIDETGNVGAIANEATGATRIYNCGVLGSLTETKDDNGIITSIHSSSKIGGSGYVGSIVGKLDGNSRVINCYSFAEITRGSTVAGIVGFHTANKHLTQDDINTKPMVMNCMFYGDITGGTNKFPVYGGRTGDNDMIKTDNTKGVNPYNYFRADALFDNGFTNINDYKRSWPAEEKYLTRFEYYRSILNSNRHLCTYWVTDKRGTDQVASDTALIAKWVLDPSKAPYPILKKWGKYPSVINPDPTRTWRPKAKDADGVVQEAQWVTRTAAKDYEGKKLGTLKVTINAGTYHAGSVTSPITDKEFIIMDMDTLNHDYGYAKIQLPYYNELFGDPTADASQWDNRYGGNYKDYVVTGWDITDVTGGTPGTFIDTDDGDVKAWESGFNFADRKCTDKDKHRTFAQGGYYYVPEGVTKITITAHWGEARYLRNAENSVDRVNVTNQSAASNGNAFTPAGSLPATFQGKTVYNDLVTAIKSLSNQGSGKTVYDQAIVLVGNLQRQNRSSHVGYSYLGDSMFPYTLMSADLDLDNEPDFCMQLQFRNAYERLGVQPVRFDFLAISELGLAIRHNNYAYAIGLMTPLGHFEITETAYMHMTQFEYDGANNGSVKTEAPLILNGGQFDQIVLRYGNKDKTSYILMGGNIWMKRFTPGWHANNTKNGGNIRHCAVNAIGGDYPEFYLSGIYHPDFTVNQDNPHCYVNGGRFGIMTGAGYEQVDGNVTFKIDHAIIDEFYGGGINASKPVTGSIVVTVDHSLVGKYCGGPKVGKMTSGKTITTNATGSVFREFYGGGNGGTSYYRASQVDDTPNDMPSASASGYTNFNNFNPLNTISSVTAASDAGTDNKGYHAEYEFEVFNSSNGTDKGSVRRAYILWTQFGTTETGSITNTLKECTFKGNFFGGGNLGNVAGDIVSTLTDCQVYGSAFGGGYSASIPSFPIHDKANAVFPTRDFTGVITDGHIPYLKDNDEIRHYTWTNDLPPEKTANNAKDAPTFQEEGKYYCYTWVSLANLGTVTGNVTLTLDGNTKIGTSGTGHHVYGGGAQSAVTGNTTVKIQGNTEVYGNVFGGGDEGIVEGSTTVNIEQ